ncbi:hypothetical protein QTL95_14510 [Rhizobium sp. S152]|uniref:hypothetical protein n=1 Tax=Rhizobium sp. S152 TaxID=3055038 RepID=UPI0025A97BF6|nr:hypothetical protein [Rhizobium sp. S152]MDM9627117.1 hypothetical protein [Rhizobium sp. S152]
MKSSLKERFARLGPVRVIDRDLSGFAADARFVMPADTSVVDVVAAAVLLHTKTNLSLAEAKACVEHLLEVDVFDTSFDRVTDTAALSAGLLKAGILVHFLPSSNTSGKTNQSAGNKAFSLG